MVATISIFIWLYIAMISLSFVEAYVEGRYPWHRRKVGWKWKFGKYYFSGYHFMLFVVMLPLFFTFPLLFIGWDIRLFGVLISAYFSGLVIEDFVYFIVNPVVKFKEFWTPFTDFYPWIRIKGRKIIPLWYIFGIVISILSWYFLWR